MILLKVHERGHRISLPGLPEVRSPVEINVSHLDLKKVLRYVHNLGINNFDIVAKEDNKLDKKTKDRRIQTKKSSSIEKKLESIESLIQQILERSPSAIPFEVKPTKNIYVKKKDPKIEDVETFIPDVDLSSLRISKSSEKKVFKKDADDNSAELLANMLESGGKKK